MKPEDFLTTDNQLDILPFDVRQGVLFLCLVDRPIDLPNLAELVDTHETIDEMIRLPFTTTDNSCIWMEQRYKQSFLSIFKWSEKVQAAEKLTNYFNNRSMGNENLGDLWLISGNKEKALNSYLEAVKEHKTNQDHVQNIRVCEKLLKLGNLTEVLELEVQNNLLVCQECCGELQDVIEIRTKILQKPIVQSDKNLYASVLRALAIDYSKQGMWSIYKNYREEAAIIFKEINKHEDSVVEFIALATRSMDELNVAKGLTYAEEALREAKISASAENISKAMAIKAYIMAMSGDYIQGQLLAQEALHLALNRNMLETAAFVYRKLAGTYEYASDFEKANVIYHDAIRFCETEKMNAQTQMCYSCLSWIFFRLGEWKKAMNVSFSIIRDDLVNNSSKSTTHCVIAIIKSLRGEVRSAEKHANEGIFLAQKEQFMMMYHLLHLPMAKINELKGNVEGAREWYCKIIDDWPLTHEKHDVLISLMDAAMFFYEQRDDVFLKKAIEIFSFISKETGNMEAIGCFAYGLGLDALLNEYKEIAVNQLKTAQKHLLPLKVPYQLILVEYHLGISYIQSGEETMGIKLLREVLNKAKKMGLAPMVSKINHVIEKTAPKKEAAFDALTPRQMDVLHLMAEGLANKEIATRLFLSTRTVDMHIRFIFDKFCCHTRTEAVKIGLERGLISS